MLSPREFDVVLIDTSPLLAVSDAIPLFSMRRWSDSSFRAFGDDARPMLRTDLVEQIRRVPGANLLGIVANDVHGRDAGVKNYGVRLRYVARAIA